MRAILSFCSLTILLACSSNKTHENIKAEKTEIHLTLSNTSNRLPATIQLSEADVDTVWSDELGCQAIRLSLDLKADNGLFKSLDKNCNAVVLEATCSGDKARSFTTGTLLEKNNPVPYDLHSSTVLYNTQERSINFEFPFRALEMPAGSQQMKFSLALYPAEFKIDAANKQEGVFISKHKKPIGNWESYTSVLAPALRELTFEIKHLSLDNQKKDPKSYDLRYAGPGYPDLYWQLNCGGEKIYTSPAKQNVTEISSIYISPDFFCTDKDLIEIGIYDQDKTSKPDKVEIIKLPITALDSGNGEMKNHGNLKNLEYRIKKKSR